MDDDRYLGADDTHIRELALKLIAGNAEGGKVDFKRELSLTSAKDKVEFCKDLSAIANSDDHRLGGYGYIVFGAEPGNLLGGLTAWEAGKADSFSASLNDIAKKYLAPVPNFHFVPFEDEQRGQWAILVVPPSSNQPHIFIKEFESTPAKHEWFVRINDTTERAGALDYARVMSKTVSLATEPLRVELQRTQLELERLKQGQIDPAWLLELMSRGAGSGEKATVPHSAKAPLERIRAQLRRPHHDLEDDLLQEALRVREAMIESSENNPQSFRSDTKAVDVMPVIEYLEATTRPYVDCLLAVVRYGAGENGGDAENAVVRSVKHLAAEPQLSGAHWEYAPQFRLYPLVLVLNALATASALRDTGKLLRKILDLKLRMERRDRSAPLITTLRRARAASEIFKIALGQNYYEPIAERMKSIVPAWVGSAVPEGNASSAFFVGEFLLALEYASAEAGIPFAGAYLYGYESHRPVGEALVEHAQVFHDLFGDRIEELLQAFDTNAARVVERAMFADGFRDGALKAWRHE